MLYAPNGKNLTLPTVLNPPLPGRFVGRMQYAPTLTDENGASNKHESAPSGRFVGRIQYAPTRDNEKRKMNDEKIRNQAKLAGIPDALIFFSHPFLISRQEKDEFRKKLMAITIEISPAGRVGAYCIRPTCIPQG